MAKSDLDTFEKNLVRTIKFANPSYKFKFDDLQEWSTSEEAVKKNLRDNEKMFEALGFYVAMRVKKEK